MKEIRNIAVIAHVDHGKTTLLDVILRYCQGVTEKENRERILDSNDLERERGITIFSKNTAVEYKDIKLNIVDTPGHSDFGGEVERILRMVNSCLLLVDAHEGPMPQTRFVLKKALELGHKIIVVINKIDKPEADIERVHEKTLELFLELNASDEQLDFPVIYSSAKNGYALLNVNDEKKDIAPLLDTILKEAPVASGKKTENFIFQVTTLDYSEYLGRICIGKVFSGGCKIGDMVYLKNEHKPEVSAAKRITKLFTFHGLKRIETNEVQQGDVVAIAGIDEMSIGDTLVSEEKINPLPMIDIEPPTVSMLFMVNDSPFSGKTGKFLTSRHIRDRLDKELKVNLSLKVEIQGEAFKVSGRGELHLAVLIENLRREGYEIGVSKPQVITREIEGALCEPFEEIVMDIPEAYSGGVIQELNRRKGAMIKIEKLSDVFSRLTFEIPTRGLIGFRNFFLTETRGEGTLSGIFLEYRPFAGDFSGRTRGALVSMIDGKASGYALFSLQERGELFIGPQTAVYEGMIIGLHTRENDLEVNPVKEKKQTNVRASGSDEGIKLTPPRKLYLEYALDLMENDEILEVTPADIRLRKKERFANLRKRKQVI
ncbi:MAG: translational GTPase TypA [Spirochaetia bacterium]|nr:translational GTPase TypA [Spirochaetia bacterium]